MANLKDIKRRIGSVKSTQKITNAMKLVSASKFAKATHLVQSSRPYGNMLDRMVKGLVLGSEQRQHQQSNLVATRSEDRAEEKEKRVLLILVGTDRGLCGPLNSYLFKEADKFLNEKSKHAVDVSLAAWGRRPASYVKKTGKKIFETKEKVVADASYLSAKLISDQLVKEFNAGNFDSVYIVYSKFQSAVAQVPTVQKVLPFDPKAVSGEVESQDCLVEPNLEELLEPMVRRWISSMVYRILLESAASEHGARMSAMDNATNNAKEVTRKLTLVYNRVRQAAITTELTEIISGAEAL